MQEMSRKNKLFTDSVIRRMTRIAIDAGAINLAQGFPDFDPPKAMMDRLAEVSHLGPHQYPITMGAPMVMGYWWGPRWLTSARRSIIALGGSKSGNP